MDRLDLVFAALADPTRRAVLAMLLEDDMAVTDVAEPFAMSLAAVSKHLVVLGRAGLIRQERRGRVTWCMLDPDGLRAASVWMQGFGQFEPVDLDAFERFLAAELAGPDASRSGRAGPDAGSGGAHEEIDDREDHDDEADKIDDAVHGFTPLSAAAPDG